MVQSGKKNRALSNRFDDLRLVPILSSSFGMVTNNRSNIDFKFNHLLKKMIIQINMFFETVTVRKVTVP